MNASWHCAHLYHDGPARRLVRGVLDPWQSRFTSREEFQWFYVTWYDPPHLRVRWSSSVAGEPLAFLRSLTRKRTDHTGRVVESPYVPETERFGGPGGLEAAERLFCASSQAASVALTRSERDSESTGLGLAVDHLLAAAIAFVGIQGAAELFRQLASGVQEGRPHLRSTDAHLDQVTQPLIPRADAIASHGPPEPLEGWFDACSSYRERLAVLRRRSELERDEHGLFVIQLHLTNNRFALPWYDEVILARAAALACDRAGGRSL